MPEYPWNGKYIIAVYLENGGQFEIAQHIANHESPTTLPGRAISFTDMRLLRDGDCDPLDRSELESAAGIGNGGTIWCGVVLGASAS
jgi:hypothetical protein